MFDNLLRCAVLATAFLTTPCLAAAQDDYPRGLLPGTVTPVRYGLELTIDPRQDGFSGKASIEVWINEPARRIWLHGLDLTEVEVRAESDGRKIDGTYTAVDAGMGVARIDFERELQTGPAMLRFSYRGRYQRGAEGLYLIEAGGERYVFSQFEATDARRVFPGFDQPGFKTPFDVTVIAARDDVVVSNAPLASTKPAGKGRVAHRFEPTLPLPTYLLAFAVGPLDVVEAPPIPANEVRELPLPLRGVATRGQGPRLAFALANTQEMVERLERYFDVAFPYPKLDLIASPSHGGAMENAGAIVYDESILLLDEDAPTTQLRWFGLAHAHELAHQWFGDLVTPWWWEDTWLNESFASWLAHKVAAAWRPALFNQADHVAGAFGVMDRDSRASSRPVREPITDSLRIASTFDALTYQKGGGVLSMFESYLGEEPFRDGVRLHVERHPHGVAASDELFAALAEASGQPAVVEAFRGFVERPGVPMIAVSLSEDGQVMDLAQSRYRPLGATYAVESSWKTPFCFSTYDGETPQRLCALIEGPHARLALPAPVTTVMPNADGAGYYRFAMNAEAMQRLVDMAADLPDTEALALVDSLGAAFRAGQLPFADLLEAARQLAWHDDRRVALGLADTLTAISNRWSTPAERDAIASALVDIYAPRLEALGLDAGAGKYAAEDTARRLLRASLTRLLALEAHHEPTLSVLADAAQRSLDDPQALDPEYREIAWTVGVRRIGAPFADEMARRATTGDNALVRNAAASALGGATDPKVSAKARETIADPALRGRDMLSVAFSQLGQPETRDAAWAWMQANLDDMRSRMPGFAQDYVYAAPSSFCDPDLRASVGRLLDAATADKRVNPGTASRTLESIDLCIAQKAALGGQVREVLGIADDAK